MNVSVNWLRDYVKISGPAQKLGDALTLVGLTCDSIEPRGDDAILELEITSNRSDCLSLIGVAREVAALVGEKVKIPGIDYKEGKAAAADLCTVRIDEPDLCSRYTARVITGVKVGPSSGWLAGRLEAVGIRPVNNVVDVTNFVLLECGHPMHAFDYDKLADHAIVVRRAAGSEKFVAIDHSEHALTPERLVIADARHPVALAGVMGGAETEVTESTTNVLLEVAEFDPVSVRRTARALNLFSESSYRFERGINREGIDWASRRACRLIVETAGGEVASGMVDVGSKDYPERCIRLRIARVEALLGISVGQKQAAGILERLGLEIVDEAEGSLMVRVPSFRRDLSREVDLIEEVARINGYENIPTGEFVPVAPGPVSMREQVLSQAGRVLAAAGYFEAIAHTLSTEDAARLFASADAEPLKVQDSGTGARASLRMSLLSGLLEAKRVNQDGGQPAVRLFEIAHRFVPAGGEKLPAENAQLALLADDDFFAVKGVLEMLFAALGLEGKAGFEPTDARAELVSTEAADVTMGGKPVGFIGRVAKSTTEKFGLDAAPVVAELDFDLLASSANLTPQFQPLPQFPVIERDLAIVVDESLAWDRVEAAVCGEEVDCLEAVEFLDVYRGKQVPKGKKSVALRMRFRLSSGTLTHEEVDKFVEKILARLEKDFAATLRT